MDPIPLLLGPGARGNEWGVEEGEPAPTFLPPQNHGASDEVPFSCGGKRRGRRPLVPQSMRSRRKGARWGDGPSGSARSCIWCKVKIAID